MFFQLKYLSKKSKIIISVIPAGIHVCSKKMDPRLTEIMPDSKFG
jgi:hypothetical protein